METTERTVYTKRNALKVTTRQTLNLEIVSQGLGRVGEIVRTNHHFVCSNITPGLLGVAFFSHKRRAAVDGATWDSYAQDLDQDLMDHGRIHSGDLACCRHDGG